MSGCADEWVYVQEIRDPGRSCGDVTSIYAGFCDVIYDLLVEITSPRNSRAIYGENRNLEFGSNLMAYGRNI